MIDAAQALDALDTAIPPELRGTRHGVSFLGERYNLLRKYIIDAADEIQQLEYALYSEARNGNDD
jgi:hypothetical protein